MKTISGRSAEPQRVKKLRAVEFVLFLAVSAVGIYAMGQGLKGLFEPGQGISILWLAVMGVAMMVLFAQMGRVHDTWPKWEERQQEQASNPEAAQELPDTH
jgi:hypothetical protein